MQSKHFGNQRSKIYFNPRNDNYMETVTIKAYPDNSSKIDALKAFMKALNIKFELQKEASYDPEFVEMIQQADIDIKQGKGKKTTSDEFDDLWK